MKTYSIPINIQRLFYKEKSAFSVGSHIIGTDLIITGNVTINLIRHSFFKIVKKHNSFYYKFSIGDKGIQKEKLIEPEYQFTVYNCQNRTINDIRKQILSDASVNITPEKGEIIAARLYKLDDEKLVMSISTSHLVSDAKSMGIIISDFLMELKRCYDKYDYIEYDKKIQTNILSKNDYQIKHIKICEFSETINSCDYKNLKKLCYKNNISLLSLLSACIGCLSGIDTETIGVLFSHRTKDTRNVVDCFVQALPVYIRDDISIFDSAREIKKQVYITHKRIRSSLDFPEPPNFQMMLSMVKNTETDLPAPKGLEVSYLRRLHTKPECDLHIYVYQYKDRLEIVFNYDPESMKIEKVQLLLEQYVDRIREITKTPSLRNISTLKYSQPLSIVSFHHIGFAVWELDIGLKRMHSMCKISHMKQPFKDKAMGVEMVTLNNEYGVKFELIAPLEKDAPCVGFLERLGEGPYHCCWEVSDIQLIFDSLEKRNIKYSIIQKSGSSALFPKMNISFILIHGFGLIEFIVNKRKTTTESISENKITAIDKHIPLSIVIDSNDLKNAVKFIMMLRYIPKNPTQGIWEDPQGRISFQIKHNRGSSDSKISKIISSQYRPNQEIHEKEYKSLSQHWSQRVCL